MKAKPVSLSLYFGIPGAGKSTYAAYLAKKDMKLSLIHISEPTRRS